jgi:hypothetical protein
MKRNEESVSILMFRALVEGFKELKRIHFVLFSPSQEFKV